MFFEQLGRELPTFLEGDAFIRFAGTSMFLLVGFLLSVPVVAGCLDKTRSRNDIVAGCICLALAFGSLGGAYLSEQAPNAQWVARHATFVADAQAALGLPVTPVDTLTRDEMSALYRKLLREYEALAALSRRLGSMGIPEQQRSALMAVMADRDAWEARGGAR